MYTRIGIHDIVTTPLKTTLFHSNRGDQLRRVILMGMFVPHFHPTSNHDYPIYSTSKFARAVGTHLLVPTLCE